MVQLERKQCMTSELTSRFENIEMHFISVALSVLSYVAVWQIVIVYRLY